MLPFKALKRFEKSAACSSHILRCDPSAKSSDPYLSPTTRSAPVNAPQASPARRPPPSDCVIRKPISKEIP